MNTPIFDQLFEEFYTEVIDVDLPFTLISALKEVANDLGVPFEMVIQDIVMDRISLS